MLFGSLTALTTSTPKTIQMCGYACSSVCTAATGMHAPWRSITQDTSPMLHRCAVKAGFPSVSEFEVHRFIDQRSLIAQHLQITRTQLNALWIRVVVGFPVLAQDSDQVVIEIGHGANFKGQYPYRRAARVCLLLSQGDALNYIRTGNLHAPRGCAQALANEQNRDNQSLHCLPSSDALHSLCQTSYQHLPAT